MRCVLLILLSFSALLSRAGTEIADTCLYPKADSAKTTAGLWSLQVSGNVSHMFHAGPYNKQILHSYGTSFYDARLKWQGLGLDSQPYDKALGRPSLQVGLLCADYSRVQVYREQTPYRSRIGRIWTLFGGLQLDFLHRRRFSMGVDLQHGVGYCEHPFDENTNTDNEVIGSPLSIYVGGGLYAKYRLSSQLSLSLGADFKHFSNGTLDRPNIGANTLGATLALHCQLNRPSAAESASAATSRPTGSGNGHDDGGASTMPFSGFYVEVVAGLGMKALNDHFARYHTKDNPLYGFFTTMVAPMYRWHLLHATGVGIDYSYADYVYKLRDYDEMNHLDGYDHSPHIMGVTLRHEVFYRHFSVNVGVGAYVKKQTGHTGKTNDSRIYQNVGLRYTPPFARHRLFVGYNVKAHYFSRVDCVQLLVGCRIGK